MPTAATAVTPRADKLVLFVSEACNLRCRYCYVMLQAGQRKPRVMTADTARMIVRRATRQLGPPNFIQFFGGEPTLDMPAIRAVVDETAAMVVERVLDRAPKFGLVTNGTSSRMADAVSFCRDHRIPVTISLDGEQRIHDALRVSAAGGGTFDKVMRAIDALHAAGVRVAIETVYTAHHIDEGCSIVDLIELFQRCGARKVILHTVYPPAPDSLCPFDDVHFDTLVRHHLDAIDWWFESLLGATDRPPIDLYFKDLLLPMLEGAGATVAGGGCPAGQRDFSIGPNGDVYSCHLLYGDGRYFLGNILRDATIRREASLPSGPGDMDECTRCFARHWCQPCGALNESWGSAWTPALRECQLRRSVVARIGQWALSRLSVPENDRTNELRRAVVSGAGQVDGALRRSLGGALNPA